MTQRLVACCTEISVVDARHADLLIANICPTLGALPIDLLVTNAALAEAWWWMLALEVAVIADLIVVLYPETIPDWILTCGTHASMAVALRWRSNRLALAGLKWVVATVTECACLLTLITDLVLVHSGKLARLEWEAAAGAHARVMAGRVRRIFADSKIAWFATEYTNTVWAVWLAINILLLSGWDLLVAIGAVHRRRLCHFSIALRTVLEAIFLLITILEGRLTGVAAAVAAYRRGSLFGFLVFPLRYAFATNLAVNNSSDTLLTENVIPIWSWHSNIRMNDLGATFAALEAPRVPGILQCDLRLRIACHALTTALTVWNRTKRGEV
jgi:hypothetical protein